MITKNKTIKIKIKIKIYIKIFNPTKRDIYSVVFA